MPAAPLDAASLPDDAGALRALLLAREAEHAAELRVAREGLAEQALLVGRLKARLANLLRERFGRLSGRLRGEVDQLELLLGDLEDGLAADGGGAGAAPPFCVDGAMRRPARRASLPDHLPRETVEHATVADGRCACARCGGALRPLGEDVTEVFEYVPGSFRVVRHVRPKMSCRGCGGISQAVALSLPIRFGLAGPGLLARALVTKYADHLPLHRQAEIYAREGVALDRSTLADWVGQSAAPLRPLADAARGTSWGGRACTGTTRPCRCSRRGWGARGPATCGSTCATTARSAGQTRPPALYR